MVNNQINLPAFLGIGAAKCGTTSLHEILNQHSQIFLHEKKELHFFENDENYNLGVKWYANYFKEAKQKLAGEITADYIFYDYVPERIFKTLGPNIKLILMLRNPVDRAYSEYLFNVRRQYINSSFEEVISHENKLNPNEFKNRFFTPVHRSLYSIHIQNFFKYFNENNFLFILFEDDFINNKDETFNKVFDFLNVSHESLNLNQLYKPSYIPKYNWLQNLVYQPNFLKRMGRKIIKAHKLKRKIKDQILPAINKSKNKIEKINPDLKNRLIQEYFIRDIEITEKLIGRSLQTWLH
jgi:hypothetical protein